MLARRAVEKTIKSEREAEIQRLDRLAGGGAEPKTTMAGAGSRHEDVQQTASQRGAEPKTTKAGGAGSRHEDGQQTALQRGAEPKMTKAGAGSRHEDGQQTASQRGAEPKTTKVDAGKGQTPTNSGHRAGRDKGLKW